MSVRSVGALSSMTKVRAVLQRRWTLLVGTLVLGILAGLASSLLNSGGDVDSYAVEQVLVASSADGSTTNVTQDALRINRGEVSDLASQALGQPERRQELTRRVEVSADAESSSITLRVVDEDQQFAADVVQAYSNAFLRVVNSELRSDDVRRREQLIEAVQLAEQELVAFDAEYPFLSDANVPPPDTPTIEALANERARRAEAISGAQQALSSFDLEMSEREPYTTLGPEPAQLVEPLVAIPSSIPFRAGLLGAVGLLLGVGLVVLIERMHRRIDTREELASLVKVPILAEIGHLEEDQLPRDDIGRVRLEGVWSEQYRRVRSAIQFVQNDGDQQHPAALAEHGAPTTSQHPGAVIEGHATGRVPRVFLFVSALPGEGKSTSTVLTGMALAETGAETLIVNADFRRPSVERYLRTSTSPSLEDLAVLSRNRPTVDQVVQHTGVDHLWLAAAGPPTLEVERRLHAARELAAEAARRGGTVLIDSSPLRVTNDPIDLLPVVDEVVLVVRAGQSTVKSLEETLSMLDMHHAPVLGVILIGTASTREMYSYYGSYFDEPAAGDRNRSRRKLVPAAFSRVRDRRGRSAPTSQPWTAPTAPSAPGSAQRLNGHNGSGFATPAGGAPQRRPTPPLPGASSAPPPYSPGADFDGSHAGIDGGPTPSSEASWEPHPPAERSPYPAGPLPVPGERDPFAPRPR